MTRTYANRRQFLHQIALASLATAPGLRSFAQASSGQREVVLQTPSGKLRGEQRAGLQTFRGIPFAEPPVGNLRFRRPVPVRPWAGTRDATRFAAAALQPGDRDVPQQEDCLYLNVWTPQQVSASASLPVFVWIHGGGFTGGTSFAPIFDGSVFARQGMVVVTVAYRLGVLGFLDLAPLLGPDFAGSANNALRDLITALEWVKANIAAFGGDPHRVTIGGESAGAKLTCLLMGAPAAKDLFSGMISESGGAERIWPRETAQSVATGFGQTWKGSTGLPASALLSAPGRSLIDAQSSFLKTWPQHFPLRCELDNDLFPRPPIDTIRSGSPRGKRLLIGTNRDESALFLGAHPTHDATAADLGNLSLPSFNEVYSHYAAVYPQFTEQQRRIRAVTAEEYWVPSIRVANAAADAQAAVWMYRLDFARNSGPYKDLAFHSEDLALVWDKPNQEFASRSAEAALATSMNLAWAAFIKGQAPAAPGLPSWPQYNARTRPTLLLNTNSTVQLQPQEAELALWKSALPG